MFEVFKEWAVLLAMNIMGIYLFYVAEYELRHPVVTALAGLTLAISWYRYGFKHGRNGNLI